MSDAMKFRQKLLVTIVSNKISKKIIKAVKSAGAEGDTVLVGRGSAPKKETSFWDLSLESEREIILNVIPDYLIEASLTEVLKKTSLKDPGEGIAFVIDISVVAGICHHCQAENADKIIQTEVNQMDHQNEHVLLVIVVNKGEASDVIDASCEAGAQGGTIINGRGSGVHEKAKLFGIDIEPEKEVILIVIKKEDSINVLKTINQKSKLNEPGKGIAFVLPVEQVVGLR